MMLQRRTIIGAVSEAPILRERWLGRVVLAVILAILLLLSFFPERYRAAVTLTPTDPQSLGLSGALGQLGALNSVFGNQTAVEIALRIGRSYYVRDIVAKRLDLMKRMDFENETATHRWLEREVTIRSLRGGIVQFETLNRDPLLAKQLVSAFASATQVQLSNISRRQTEYKRDVLLKLVSDSSDRLALASSAFDTFRLSNRYAIPNDSIGEIGSQIPRLQAAIRAKEVALDAAREFGTDENILVRQIRAEISALRRQLANAETTSPMQKDSVGQVVRASTQAEKLQRELTIAQNLYDGYMRFLDGTSVEDLTSTASVRILEPAYVDTDRQVNWNALAAALAVGLLWATIEFYRLRPPVGERTRFREE